MIFERMKRNRSGRLGVVSVPLSKAIGKAGLRTVISVTLPFPPNLSPLYNYFVDYLGIDYGSKFIGLAWSSDDLKVVVPLKALRVRSTEQVLRDLRTIVNERGCDAFVIGLPVHADGTEGQRVKEVRYFAELLKQHFNVKIYFQDERFSTQTARTLTGTNNLSLRQAKAKKEKGVIDSAAAAVILEEWMERH